MSSIIYYQRLAAAVFAQCRQHGVSQDNLKREIRQSPALQPILPCISHHVLQPDPKFFFTRFGMHFITSHSTIEDALFVWVPPFD